MRLGGPVNNHSKAPKDWVLEHRKRGYEAAYCPAVSIHEPEIIQAYRQEASRCDIVIAEVGAWSNPLSSDPMVRQAALNRCKEQLALAEEIGALCCVNIAGSRGLQWDGPHADNFSESSFELIVDTVREIIDSVKPKSSFYALEMMPWMFPHDPDSYLRLVKWIDRTQFGVHLDPVNIITSPERFFKNGALLQECFDKLGPYIKSCHAKDIQLSDRLTVHLDAVRPGLGNLDYRTYLSLLRTLGKDVPLMLEHLSSDEEYRLAAKFITALEKEV